MVQFLLKLAPRRERFRTVLAAVTVFLTVGPSPAKEQPKPKSPGTVMVPLLELEGGRKLTYERAFSSELEVKTKRGFWNRLVEVVAGTPDYHALQGPYSVAVDSKGRIIVSDPPAGGIHIFDFAKEKYKFISRRKEQDGLAIPQCVAVDAADNIYVTDSDTGKIFVFDSDGKFERVIGSLKGGEGFFKRPTGIAVDSQTQRIYVTDTLRNKIYVLDMQGNVLQTIGKTGTGDGEFNYPTELCLYGDNLLVVDAMNFRVQVLDRSGNFRYAIGRIGEQRGQIFRAKGIAMDSEKHLYVVEGLSGLVQVFDKDGNLLYYFGQKGAGLGEFQMPTGLFIDRNDRVYVVDSYNRRIQIFHYFGLPPQTEGVKQ